MSEGQQAQAEEVSSLIEFADDISNAEAPAALPRGEYKAIIKKVTPKTSATKHTRYAEVMFHISPEQYPADFRDEGNPNGENLFYRLISLESNKQAMFGVKQFCQTIGAPLGKTIDLNDWIGREATVVVVHEDYQGAPRANITKVKANA